ncbi:hypothetical protein IT575_03925 [bacterium]|nr:hypothetical protein [bacterium]
MRRYLPLTLLLLAALSGPAFSASGSPQQARPDLFELARLVQLDGGPAAQSAVRPGGLSILAPGLTVLVWLGGEEAWRPGTALSWPPVQSGLSRRCQSEALPTTQARMRPALLRGP